MKGDQLHNLLNSLNQGEKNQCTRYLLPNGRKESKYARLYRILSRQEVYDEPQLFKQLYGGEPAPNRKFEATCDYLGELLVQALAQRDGQTASWLPRVRIAREKGLVRMAVKYLSRALQLALQHEEFEELLLLFQEKEILKRHFSVEIKEEKTWPNRSEILESVINLEHLSEILEELRAVRWRALTGKAELLKYTEKLEGIKPRTQRERYLFHKVEMQLATLQGDIFQAWSCQQKIMQVIYQTEVDSIQKCRIEESGNMIRICHMVGEFEEADLELMRLKVAPVRTVYDQELLHRHMLCAVFISGITLGKVSQAHSALQEFQEIAPGISERHLGKLHFYASLFLVWTGNWAQAKVHLQAMQKLPLRYKRVFRWQPDLLLAITYLEEEDPDLAEVCLSRMARKIGQDPYLQKMIKGLERLLYNQGKEARLLLVNLKSTLEAMKKELPGRAEAKYFDLCLWIDGKIQGKSILDLAKEQQYDPAKRAFTMAEVKSHL